MMRTSGGKVKRLVLDPVGFFDYLNNMQIEISGPVERFRLVCGVCVCVCMYHITQK